MRRNPNMSSSPSPSTTATLVQAAAAVAGAQQYPAGALYVVATPIGNLADFSLQLAIAIHAKVLAGGLKAGGALLAHQLSQRGRLGTDAAHCLLISAGRQCPLQCLA